MLSLNISMPIPENVRKILFSQQYRIVGNHSAVKICHWTKKSLSENKVCFKEKWYGIKSHRCMEFSPNVIWCDHRCLWCWRIQSNDRENVSWKEFPFEEEPDEPKEILIKAIEERKKLLSGFKGNEKVDRKKWEEALVPTNIAISLSGEPCLYPKLSELIEEAHRMKMKSFLVTNGTFPEILEKISLPWQLYITLPAPDEETYIKACRPLIENGWERINRSLELFPSLNCRKAIRLTLVKDLNLKSPQNYAKLILKAEPDFVEIKSYMHVGESQKRLKKENMPSMDEIRDFARKISELISYEYKDEDEASRVVLLTKR